MLRSTLRIIATAGLTISAFTIVTAAPADAAQTLHYVFSPDSYYDYYSPPVHTPVMGSFDFDAATGTLSNVDYTSVSGHFTTGAEYTLGVDTEIYFGDRAGNYDVYQLASGLKGGGSIKIVSGTHPSIPISAAGSLNGNATPAVPEPAAWAMMVAGFALAGGAIRRRRAVVRTAVA